MATLRIICFAVLTTSLMASSAYAQNSTKPLNLSVPPSSGFPVASAASTTPVSTAPSSTTTPASPTQSSTNTTPGVWYGDHSGANVAGVSDNDPNDATDSCDDATVNKPKVHGSVSTGVVAGNHFSGNYQAATVNVTKPLGDCKHPKGSLSITAHVSQGHVGYRGSRATPT
jgi:hypothetical protein